MCGRFSLGVDTDRLVAEFGLARVAVAHSPRFNIAPTQPVAAVVNGPDGLRLGALRWGLLPGFRARPTVGPPLINARSETVHSTPSFREPFRSRRCWVLADGFYEWARRPDGSRVPYHFRLPDGRPFAFAGLWDRWSGGEEEVVSCAILTAPANEAVAPVHDRMPVILDAGNRLEWLDPDAPPDRLRGLLRPFAGALVGHPVSTRVNSPAHDDAELRHPVEPPVPPP